MREKATCSIRTATPTDYPPLVVLSTEVHALHAAAYPKIFRPAEHANALPQGWFDELLSGDMSTIQVAEVAESIVGFAIVEVFDAPPFEALLPRRTVFIGSMVVTETQRGRGIGRALVAAAVAWGRTKGATTLELTVWERNQAARSFYERLGLTAIHSTLSLEL